MSSYEPGQAVHMDNEFHTFLDPDQQDLQFYIEFEGSFEPYRKYINHAAYPLFPRTANPFEREVTAYRFQMEWALEQALRADYDFEWNSDMIVEARDEIMAKTKMFAHELWKQSIVLRGGDFVVVWQGGEPGYQEKKWEDTREGRDDNVEMKKFVQQMYERMIMDEQMDRLNL